MTRSSALQPDPVSVRDALQRILDSGAVPSGSILAKVLTYVVDRTLAGDGKSIKAYTIAVEALGRSEDFDPDRDSTVRVAAMRLRAALDLYYSGPGAEDPLRIRLVPGSYRPQFEVQDEPEPCEPEVPEPPPGFLARLPLRRVSTRLWLMTLTAVLAVDIVVTLSLAATQMRQSRASIAPPPAARVQDARAQEALPIRAVSAEKVPSDGLRIPIGTAQN